MPKIFRETLGIDVDFVRIHRNGVRAQHNGKPVSITAKLSDRSKKDEILHENQKKKTKKRNYPSLFPHNNHILQWPQKSKLMKNLTLSAGRIFLQSCTETTFFWGTVLPTKRKFQSSQMLTHSRSHRSRRKTWTLTDPVVKDGPEFSAIGVIVHTVEDVQNMYRKVCIDPYAAAANSRILVYRFRREDGKTVENYHDDDEHGAGRRFLRYMQESEIHNSAFVVTRWMGDGHIGPQRFTIMESLMNDLANDLGSD